MDKRFLCLLFLFLAMVSCGTAARLSRIRKSGDAPDLQIPARALHSQLDTSIARPDSIVITDESGSEMYLLKAVRDSASGEMVASDVIQAAVVTARFRNVAERAGRVSLEFDVIVPSEIRDSRWQLVLQPALKVRGDSVCLEKILVTGREYRRAQLRGYQQYERFVSRIIGDSAAFIDYRNLEIFLQRTLPQIFALKTDSTFVSDEQLEGYYGVSEREAVLHYTNMLALSWNESRISRKGRMYEKYVKAPIVTEGIRLDTVLVDANGDFVYRYVQEVPARRDMKKIEVFLSGEILEQGRRIYEIPRSEPICFYVSSLTSFIDRTPRYKLRIIERRAYLNAECLLEFGLGKSEIDLSLGDNRAQGRRMKENILCLLDNDDFELDSITVASFASPEGSRKANERLCLRRSRAASAFFADYVHFAQDSLQLSYEPIPVLARNGGENWAALSDLVSVDGSIPEPFVDIFYESLSIPDLDARESRLRSAAGYSYVRREIYPRLRTVHFNFFLHRKGMVKDTIHTTELDSLYMKGLDLLEEREFEEALEILGPYSDFNTAIAYMCLDRNVSAMSVLKDSPRSARTDYLYAILCSRHGDEQEAVRRFLDACRADPSYVFRGNLDPEISVLIKKYCLTQLLNF